MVSSLSNKVTTVRFVSWSVIFEGFSSSIVVEFSETANFTWGDADMTLVSKTRFLAQLRDMDPMPELNELRERVKSIPDDVYIDLEI